MPSIEFWATDSDPGPAALDLPILGDPVGATATLITTDTSPLLRYYPLNTTLSGRFVVMRLAMGTFNPGGSELQLTLAGADLPFAITEFVRNDVAQQLEITFNSVPDRDYAIDLSENLTSGQWFEGIDLQGEAGATSTTGAVSFDLIRLNFAGVLPDDLTARVRDVEMQDDPNP